jgi:hypothetical protein
MAIFSNADCVRLIYKLNGCKTLPDCIDILLDVAADLPPCQSKTRPDSGWREQFILLIESLVSLEESHGLGWIPQYKIFTPGNTKLSFVSFSSLPFITCPGMGACGLFHISDEILERGFCYSTKAWRVPAGFLRQLQNYLLMRFYRSIIEMAWYEIPDCVEVRLYVDGDFSSIEELRWWFRMLDARPDLLAYGYSKSFILFLQWHDDGNDFPDNYVLNISSGHKYDQDTMDRVLALPCARNEFVGVEVDSRFFVKRKGYDRYSDPA